MSSTDFQSYFITQAKQMSMAPCPVFSSSLKCKICEYEAFMLVSYNSYLSEHPDIDSPQSALPPGIPYWPLRGPFLSCTNNMQSSLIRMAPAEMQKLQQGATRSFCLLIHRQRVTLWPAPLWMLNPLEQRQGMRPRLSPFKWTHTELVSSLIWASLLPSISVFIILSIQSLKSGYMILEVNVKCTDRQWSILYSM